MTENSTPHGSGDMDANFSINDLVDALNAEQPNAEAKMKMTIAELFPAFKAALGRGVPPKQLTELMTTKGLRLHHASFRKLWNDEIKRRNANGETVYCNTCGAPLNSERDGHVPDTHSFGESDDMVINGGGQ